MRTRKILCMTYRPGHANPAVNEEPCQGDCYAEGDVIRIKEGWTVEELRVAMNHILDIHAHICGNANFRLGIDLDEAKNVFIGTFYHFGALDVVTEDSVQKTVEGLAGVAKEYFTSEQYRTDFANDPGLGHAACQHGDETALKNWMAQVGGFDVAVLS